MKRLLVFLLSSISLPAQVAFLAHKTTTLASSAEVVTIQQPSNSSKLVEFKSAFVYCAAACTVTLERNGTPATSTTLTPVNVNPGENSVTATAWSTSNVGVGTVLNSVSLGAGAYIVFDLSDIKLKSNNDRGQNFTIRTSSITGDVIITIKWTER